MRSGKRIGMVVVVLCLVFGTKAEEMKVKDFCAINGISFFHIHGEPNRWEIARNRIKAADWLGVKWHRCDFWWSIIEPKKGQFQFSYSDKAVNMLVSEDRKLMPILCYNPAWEPHTSPVTDEQQELYAKYVYSMVNRYKDKIKDWEIWNEPNITPFWVPRPDAEHYASLLKRAYRAAKKADKDCNVIGFCTAGADFPFIEKVYELGGGNACDTLSYHHYNDLKDESVLEREIYEVKHIMNRYGDVNKKIWITEMGLPTGFNADVIKPFYEGEQAVWMVKKLLTALSTRVVERVFWFTLNDWTTDPEADGHWGVTDFTLLPKPSGFAYRTFMRMLGDKNYVGKIYLTDTAQCFLFSKDSNEVVGVVWTKKRTETVRLFSEDKELKVFTLYGAPDSVFRGDYAEIELTPIPVYVHGLNNGYLMLASLRSTRVPLFLVPGEKRTLKINLWNPYSRTQVVEINGAMKGEEVTIEHAQLKLKKRATQEIDVELGINPESKSGWKELKFSLSSKKIPSLQHCYATLPVKIIEPIKGEITVSSDGDVFQMDAKVKNLSETTLSGKAFWRLEPEGDVKQPPKVIKEFRPNQVLNYDARLSAGYGEWAVKLDITFDITGDRKFSVKKNFAVVPFLESAPITIDGVLNEWSGFPAIRLGKREQLLEEREADSWNPYDISGVIKLCADKNNIYIAADITDDVGGINPYKDGDIWRGDGIELYLGFNGPTGDNWYGEGDFQIGLTPGYNDTQPFCWIWKVGKLNKRFDSAEIASKKSDSGYTIEARLPIEELGVGELQSPKLLGFDIALNDLDDPEAKEKDFVLMWNGTNQNWRDPSGWGVLKLLSPPQN